MVLIGRACFIFIIVTQRMLTEYVKNERHKNYLTRMLVHTTINGNLTSATLAVVAQCMPTSVQRVTQYTPDMIQSVKSGVTFLGVEPCER